MIVNSKDIEQKPMYCHVCDKALEVGQSYEKITTHGRKKIVVHTNCIGK